jgi:hypothetical protein
MGYGKMGMPCAPCCGGGGITFCGASGLTNPLTFTFNYYPSLAGYGVLIHVVTTLTWDGTSWSSPIMYLGGGGGTNWIGFSLLCISGRPVFYITYYNDGAGSSILAGPGVEATSGYTTGPFSLTVANDHAVVHDGVITD